MKVFNQRCGFLFPHVLTALVVCLLFAGCEVDDPAKEEVPELITTVSLVFAPDDGGEDVMITAEDPDGEGVQDIVIPAAIRLAPNTKYTLLIRLINGLADRTQPEYDVSEEVEEEADEHMFFFAWTQSLFADPDGDGNIENRAGPVNYMDADVNGQPLGLKTLWTTGAPSAGEFRIILKHQPELKSEISDAHTGETDLDITFPIIID
jgi:hypothetical protein